MDGSFARGPHHSGHASNYGWGRIQEEINDIVEIGMTNETRAHAKEKGLGNDFGAVTDAETRLVQLDQERPAERGSMLPQAEPSLLVKFEHGKNCHHRRVGRSSRSSF